MLLIYSPQSNTRLQYICKFIFEEILHKSYSITTDYINFNKHDGNKINYSNSYFENSFQIKPQGLLLETGITQQKIECFNFNNCKTFFKSENSDYPFDIFAATFYLITRYEEYLPHHKDMYGRYAHTNSLAYTEGFLNLPLINIWINDLAQVLKNSFKNFNFQFPNFSFLPTYDIDIAWSYKQKGFLRNSAGFIKSPSIGRLTALLGLKDDPFDSYNFLDSTHQLYNLKPLYFFLVAKENGIYDKNILPDNDAMQDLIKSHKEKYDIAIHPSWKSNDAIEILKAEKEILETICDSNIYSSRQHYIKFNLPNGYNRLIDANIKNDYSMGYGSTNGFRASVASSFWWYDLKNEKTTTLRIHPFCFMDANCYYEQKLTLEESFKEIMHYYLQCKNANGTLITIFHNNF
ncbi:MAG: hypothetical protein ABL929_03520 [Ferruginibacter sp.]